MAGEGTAPLGHNGIGFGFFGVIIPLYSIFVDIDSTLNRPIGHGKVIQFHEWAIFVFNYFSAIPAPRTLYIGEVFPGIQAVRHFDNNRFTFINAEHFGKSDTFFRLESWPGAAPDIGYIEMLPQPFIEFTGNADQS